MKLWGGGRGKPPSILHLDTRRRWVVNCRPQPMNRRFWKIENSFNTNGIRGPSVNDVAYSRDATPSVVKSGIGPFYLKLLYFFFQWRHVDAEKMTFNRPHLLPAWFSVNYSCLPIAVTSRSKAWVCSRLLAEFPVSYPARSTDIFLPWVLCVKQTDVSATGWSLFQGSLTKCVSLCTIRGHNSPTGQSYQVCVIVYDQGTRQSNRAVLPSVCHCVRSGETTVQQSNSPLLLQRSTKNISRWRVVHRVTSAVNVNYECLQSEEPIVHTVQLRHRTVKSNFIKLLKTADRNVRFRCLTAVLMKISSFRDSKWYGSTYRSHCFQGASYFSFQDNGIAFRYIKGKDRELLQTLVSRPRQNTK